MLPDSWRRLRSEREVALEMIEENRRLRVLLADVRQLLPAIIDDARDVILRIDAETARDRDAA